MVDDRPELSRKEVKERTKRLVTAKPEYGELIRKILAEMERDHDDHDREDPTQVDYRNITINLGKLGYLKRKKLFFKPIDTGTWKVWECTNKEAIEEGLQEAEEEKMEKKRMEEALSTEDARSEIGKIMDKDEEFHRYLDEIDLEEVKGFGKDFSIAKLGDRFEEWFGETYIDLLLSLVQQYSMCEAEILAPDGNPTDLRTGFNLAFFGDPGTGKTFASVDLILGSDEVPAFGIPGRNRYCSGMTPAAFIRRAEAYEGRRFNFIVPEFREWFTHSGSMAERLKLALEGKPLKYETARYTIPSYEFSSFFNVNYNVQVREESWSSISNDPHFKALRDRMLCRLHRMSSERYESIAESQLNLIMGKKELKKEAENVREHLATVFVAETRSEKVDEIPTKKVRLTEEVIDTLRRKRRRTLSEFEKPLFSPRLEKRVLKLACGATLLEYFKSDGEVLEVSDAACRFAKEVFDREIKTRMLESN